MLDLLSTHLQASLLATGKLSLMLKQEDLISILEDAVYHHALEAIEKGVTLEINSTYRPIVRMDIAYLQDVFTQLLENALDQSERDSTVKINIEENVKNVRIVMTFIGSDEQNSLNEFDDEWNLGLRWNMQTGMTRTFKTSLPLLRQVVEYHGGMLWVSKQGQQKLTNYTVELPVADMKSWTRSA